jgi:hypothetical protein
MAKSRPAVQVGFGDAVNRFVRQVLGPPGQKGIGDLARGHSAMQARSPGIAVVDAGAADIEDAADAASKSKQPCAADASDRAAQPRPDVLTALLVVLFGVRLLAARVRKRSKWATKSRRSTSA